MGSYDTEGKLSYKELKVNLDKIESIENVPDPEITEESFILKDDKYVLTVKVDGYDVDIEKNGNVTVNGERNQTANNPNPTPTPDTPEPEEPPEETTIKVTPNDILSCADKTEYYGAAVTGYSAGGISDWRIFYADENNIYLITDDYISSSQAPKGRNGASVNVGSTDYQFTFTDIIKGYNGYSDIKNIDVTGGAWMFKDLKEVKYPTRN